MVDVLILRDNVLPDPSINRIEAELLKSSSLCEQVQYSRVLVEVDGDICFFALGREIKPKIVVNWVQTRDFRAFELIKAFEAAGFPVVNKADAWWVSGSDFLTSLTLYQAQVVHPFAWHTASGMGILENQERLEYPLIHLPSGKIGNTALVHLADRPTLQARMQAFVKSQQNLDFQKARESEYLGLVKVIVLNGRAEVACSAGNPRSQPATFKQWWNQRQGNRLALLALNDDFAAKAEKAAAAIGLDLCCVELYQYPDGWEVAGVNACPDLKTIEDSFGLNMAGRFAESVNKRMSAPH